MRNIFRILGIVMVVVGLGVLAYATFNLPQANATVSQWSTCISTGAQCGTDNGTQSQTVHAEFIGICPIGYHYQNNGDYNQRCHRTENCDWYHDHDLFCPAEHHAPLGTICPSGYIKTGSGDDTVCSKVITQACHTGTVDYSACEQAGQCPTSCGHEASRVPDGKGGYISCDATPACETDVCPNIDGVQTQIPDGMVLQDGQCVTVPVTPTATPSATTNSSSSNTSSTQAPVCGDGNTVKLPANPFVVRNGEEATVNFFITEGDSANIYYRVVGQTDWQYSVLDVKPNSDNFVSYTIHGLTPALGYDFGIQQKQGCGGGQLVTAVIVDGPISRVFPFSYWEWSK